MFNTNFIYLDFLQGNEAAHSDLMMAIIWFVFRWNRYFLLFFERKIPSINIWMPVLWNYSMCQTQFPISNGRDFVDWLWHCDSLPSAAMTLAAEVGGAHSGAIFVHAAGSNPWGTIWESVKFTINQTSASRQD